MSKAIIKAMEERLRQVNEEGFTAERDDQYSSGELATAAGCYALISGYPGERYGALGKGSPLSSPSLWPWAGRWWKPSPDPKRNIIKAMALLAAEYDRIERAEAAAKPATAPETIYSTDDEWQSCSYDDLQELIEDRERIAGDVIYMGIKRYAPATNYTLNLHESVIENMQVQSEDDAGEVAEGYPEVTKPQEQVLQSLIDAWAEQYCTPDFYEIADVKNYIITAEDVEASQ